MPKGVAADAAGIEGAGAGGTTATAAAATATGVTMRGADRDGSVATGWECCTTLRGAAGVTDGGGGEGGGVFSGAGGSRATGVSRSARAVDSEPGTRRGIAANISESSASLARIAVTTAAYESRWSRRVNCAR